LVVVVEETELRQQIHGTLLMVVQVAVAVLYLLVAHGQLLELVFLGKVILEDWELMLQIHHQAVAVAELVQQDQMQH
jgi:hypothetical protein